MGTSHEDKNTFLIISGSCFLECEVFQTKVVERIRIHIFCSVWKSCRLWDNVEKYCRTGEATGDNMTRAHCVLCTYGKTHTHTHTIGICNWLVFPCNNRCTNAPQCEVCCLRVNGCFDYHSLSYSFVSVFLSLYTWLYVLCASV